MISAPSFPHVCWHPVWREPASVRTRRPALEPAQHSGCLGFLKSHLFAGGACLVGVVPASGIGPAQTGCLASPRALGGSFNILYLHLGLCATRIITWWSGGQKNQSIEIGCPTEEVLKKQGLLLLLKPLGTLPSFTQLITHVYPPSLSLCLLSVSHFSSLLCFFMFFQLYRYFSV